MKLRDGVMIRDCMAPVELGEEPLDDVEPRAGCRREVERPARMARQPSPDLRMLVGGVQRTNDRNRPIYAALTSVWPVDFQFQGKSSSSFGFM